jgi:hypothetical protein
MRTLLSATAFERAMSKVHARLNGWPPRRLVDQEPFGSLLHRLAGDAVDRTFQGDGAR